MKKILSVILSVIILLAFNFTTAFATGDTSSLTEDAPTSFEADYDVETEDSLDISDSTENIENEEITDVTDIVEEEEVTDTKEEENKTENEEKTEEKVEEETTGPLIEPQYTTFKDFLKNNLVLLILLSGCGIYLAVKKKQRGENILPDFSLLRKNKEE